MGHRTAYLYPTFLKSTITANKGILVVKWYQQIDEKLDN